MFSTLTSLIPLFGYISLEPLKDGRGKEQKKMECHQRPMPTSKMIRPNRASKTSKQSMLLVHSR
ncbi:hypothetical protein BgiMline_022563, partial [Biomphalaria glabrata]